MLPGSGVVLSCYTELEILKVALDQFSDVVWYAKVIEGRSQDLVRDRPKGIGEV